MISQRRVDADEALLTDLYASGNNYMWGNETMILDDWMMADMVSAPERKVIAYGYEGLDSIIFKNKTIFADTAVIQNRGAGTDETG